MDEDQSAARFLAVVEQIEKTAPVVIDATGAALIAAIYLGIGSDSRSLSNKLGIAHAIALRSISSLSGRLLKVAKRDTRTQRTFIELTDEGKALAHSASDVRLKRTLSES
ncbi:hypothetical protein G6L28_06765 [Agrobacterium larrymoorei]|uniref:hypothetical protein n=1 Tax=Agrobacterium larrymoorei TaxID=160699 RepID=UPI0015744B05|nr:hypothetical protein [Agrobacterium larrymoorei]NTJ42301.1 hypothetical protein [Agrobacterium larrymoorei]